MTQIRTLRGRFLLRARNLSAGWGPRPVLRDLSVDVARGERIAVLGPNGAGKSTLFDALAGRLALSAGGIAFGGTDVGRLPLYRRARLGLAYVPQEPSAFPTLSVVDNLRAALRAPAARGARGVELDRVLEAWGLRSVSDRRAEVLSGGERRRLEVARALLLQPKMLLLDEPFSGLDPVGRKALLAGLAGIAPQTAVLVSDHAADDVLLFADRVLLLLDGALAFDGPRKAFSPDLPAYRRYFGS
ncbi:MAG: ATP-binding cassette domain-containing protein [Myxococcota bacterium]|nr:ATP-binding cassette domain-containing protein [Myxococcota bacterium]